MFKTAGVIAASAALTASAESEHHPQPRLHQRRPRPHNVDRARLEQPQGKAGDWIIPPEPTPAPVAPSALSTSN